MTVASARRRLAVLPAIVLVAFVILVVRLWYLQALEGPRLAALSDGNRIRVRPVVAPRGMLYDRHGVPLVESRPTFRLAAVPRELVGARPRELWSWALDHWSVGALRGQRALHIRSDEL